MRRGWPAGRTAIFGGRVDGFNGYLTHVGDLKGWSAVIGRRGASLSDMLLHKEKINVLPWRISVWERKDDSARVDIFRVLAFSAMECKMASNPKR